MTDEAAETVETNPYVEDSTTEFDPVDALSEDAAREQAAALRERVDGVELRRRVLDVRIGLDGFGRFVGH